MRPETFLERLRTVTEDVTHADIGRRLSRLTAGHARALLTADNAEDLADRIVAQGLSVRDTEALTRDKGDAPKKASGPRKAAKDADTASLEVDLEDALGMSVDITDRGGAGAVTIKYASLEQLDEICRRLMRR